MLDTSGKDTQGLTIKQAYDAYFEIFFVFSTFVIFAFIIRSVFL